MAYIVWNVFRKTEKQDMKKLLQKSVSWQERLIRNWQILSLKPVQRVTGSEKIERKYWCVLGMNGNHGFAVIIEK